MGKKLVKPNIDLTIGLDIGYGVSKAVTKQQRIRIPSVWGHAREIKYMLADLAQKYPGMQLRDEDGDWFIGDLAFSQLPTGELLRARGRTANKDTLGQQNRLRLAKAAIGKLLPGERNGDVIRLRIATGLPVDHIRDAGTLKETLIGKHRIQTDETDFVAEIVEVMVMPQPYGTIYANTLTDNGDVSPDHHYARIGVVDVGTFTVDVTLETKGDYIDAQSGSTETGIYTAQERIASILERDYGEKLPYDIIEEVLRTGCYAAYGDEAPADYRGEVKEALEPLRSATMVLLSEKWKVGSAIQVIYVSGGGASLVYDAVKRAYRQARLMDDAQMANAVGYLNYALLTGKEMV